MKIKQLQWKEYDDGETYEAYGFLGSFLFSSFLISVSNHGFGDEYTAALMLNDYPEEEKDFPTVDEAKAYCQSLLEKQVKCALEFVDFDS